MALVFSTSSRDARVLSRIARVAAAGRVAADRLAREARADRAHARAIARAARLESSLVAEFGEGALFGVKVCDVDAKWRATNVAASAVAWLVASVGDVEYWSMDR